jgi:hypothetical protein
MLVWSIGDRLDTRKAVHPIPDHRNLLRPLLSTHILMHILILTNTHESIEGGATDRTDHLCGRQAEEWRWQVASDTSQGGLTDYSDLGDGAR